MLKWKQAQLLHGDLRAMRCAWKEAAPVTLHIKSSAVGEEGNRLVQETRTTSLSWHHHLKQTPKGGKQGTTCTEVGVRSANRQL